MIRAGDFEPTSPQPQYPETFAGILRQVMRLGARGQPEITTAPSDKGRKGQITSNGHGPNDRASSDGNVNAPIGHASSGATAHWTRFQGRPCNSGGSGAIGAACAVPDTAAKIKPATAIANTVRNMCLSFCASLVAHGRSRFSQSSHVRNAFAALRRNLERRTNQNVRADHNQKTAGSNLMPCRWKPYWTSVQPTCRSSRLRLWLKTRCGRQSADFDLETGRDFLTTGYHWFAVATCTVGLLRQR